MTEAQHSPPAHPQTVSKMITSFHGLLLVLCVVVVAMSMLMRTDDSSSVYLPGSSWPMPDSCLTKRYIGMDCPGCGMTRAFIQIGHGRFAQAAQLNAASFIVYAFFVIQIPWHAMQLLRIRNGDGPLDRWWTIVPALIVIAALVGCWCWKFFL